MLSFRRRDSSSVEGLLTAGATLACRLCDLEGLASSTLLEGLRGPVSVEGFALLDLLRLAGSAAVLVVEVCFGGSFFFLSLGDSPFLSVSLLGRNGLRRLHCSEVTPFDPTAGGEAVFNRSMGKGDGSVDS